MLLQLIACKHRFLFLSFSHKLASTYFLPPIHKTLLISIYFSLQLCIHNSSRALRCTFLYKLQFVMNFKKSLNFFICKDLNFLVLFVFTIELKNFKLGTCNIILQLNHASFFLDFMLHEIQSHEFGLLYTEFLFPQRLLLYHFVKVFDLKFNFFLLLWICNPHKVFLHISELFHNRFFFFL